MKHWLPKILLVVFIALLLLPQLRSSAQENLEQVCGSQNLEKKSQELSREKYRSLLRKCLNYYEKENKQIEGKVEETRQRKQTLENKIYFLTQQIRNLNNEIRQSNLVIEDLRYQIEDTEDSIEETSIKIQESTRKLIEILRTIYEENEKTTVEILLAEDKLSSFFDNLVSLEVLSSKNRKLLKDIKDLKNYLKEQKEKLMTEKDSLEKMVAIQQFKKRQNQQIKQEKAQLKRMTEQEYQRYLAEKEETEERIEDISAKLWKTLVGVREVPKYGKAVEVAQGVEEQTGVRGAFLLGILTQESRIGRNVGQCVLKDFETGMGVKVENGRKWPRVMKPGRDIPVFRRTIQQLNKQQNLGMNPQNTLVSCWIATCCNSSVTDYDYGATVDDNGNIHCSYSSYVPFGWGGAMGPAQFIPSTWDKIDEKVTRITGEAADPWNFSHAALGSALYLKNYCGADTNERRAAACYLGTDYLNYVNNVLSLAECHQSYIDTGAMSASCQERIGLE